MIGLCKCIYVCVCVGGGGGELRKGVPQIRKLCFEVSL